MLEQLYNPSILYPFVFTENITEEQRKTAQSIKDCRICLLLRGYQMASVYLTKATGDTLTFKIREPAQTDYLVQISVNGKVKADNKYIVADNTFVTPSNTAFVPLSQSDTPLELLTEKTIQIDKALNVSVISRKVHTPAEPKSEIQYELKDITALELNTGYNTEVQVEDNSVLISASQGLGKGNPSGYNYWEEYKTGSTEEINRQYTGLKWINGYRANVSIGASASLLLGIDTTTFSDGVFSGSALNIHLKRKPVQIQS